MTFTEADAENDGLIKREVGREMAKVARTNNPDLFGHFENVAEQKGRDPSDIFGEMVLRALESQDFADRVLGAEVDMMQLNADEIRLEDVKYVQKLADELGINDQEESRDPIDQLIESRIQSISQSPIPRLNDNETVDQGSNEQVTRHMKRVTEKIDELEEKIEDNDYEEGDSGEDGDGEKSIDDLFGQGQDVDDNEEEIEMDDSGTDKESDRGSEPETKGDVPDYPVEMGDEGEQGEVDEEESEPSDGEGEGSVDDLISPDIGGDFDDVVNEDQRDRDRSGDAEEDGGDGSEGEEDVDEPAFSSKEANEE